MSTDSPAPSDADLLSGSPQAFGLFYERHLPWVLSWLHAKVRDRELAADLAGEVFASALQAREAFDAARSERADPWLQAIARNVLIDSVRRGRVEDRARRALGIDPLALSDQDLERVDELIDSARRAVAIGGALARLPQDQAESIRARILDDQDYDEIAARMRCSPAVARQRVSRGLRNLRTALEGDE